MGEALRSLVMLVWAVSAVSTDANAQSNIVTISETESENAPTVIYGASENTFAQKDEAIVVQPKNGGNPLGDPIVNNDSILPANVNNTSANVKTKQVQPSNVVNEVSQQNPPISEETPQQMNSEIQNTLYESGGRIYDEQSYPINDINTITQPNLDKEITNYPSY